MAFKEFETNFDEFEAEDLQPGIFLTIFLEWRESEVSRRAFNSRSHGRAPKQLKKGRGAPEDP